MRFLAGALLLSALAAAGPPREGPEPDGAVADAARWTGPKGCASGSHRSRALPVVTEVEEAWRIDLDEVWTPPVHWDGTGYVVADAERKTHLLAFDLASGREIARVQLRGFVRGSPLLVWDHLVLLQPEERQLNGYRLSGRRLEATWIFRGAGGANAPEIRHPVVHDNEVYCLLGGVLVRLRPGSGQPGWAALMPPNIERFGPPAIFGRHVLVAGYGPLWRSRDGKDVSDLRLAVFDRANRKAATVHDICQAAPGPATSGPEVTVTQSTVYIGSPWRLFATDGRATHAIVPATIEEGGIRLGKAGLWTSEVAPSHHPRHGGLLLSTIGGVKGLVWCADRDGGFYRLAEEAAQPDLFGDRVTPTVLGEVVYFGSWAADLATDEILWRLPVKGVTYPVVPADGLILVVEAGRALRAFRGRGRL